MSVAINIVDESTSGEITNQAKLVIASNRIAVRSIIEERVRSEVQRFNTETDRKGVFRGLVQPIDTESDLNGYRLKKNRLIDPDKQVELALSAFEENGFFMLVDDKQVDSLDEQISVTQDTKVSFLKLVQLVGG